MANKYRRYKGTELTNTADQYFTPSTRFPCQPGNYNLLSDSRLPRSHYYGCGTSSRGASRCPVFNFGLRSYNPLSVSRTSRRLDSHTPPFGRLRSIDRCCMGYAGSYCVNCATSYCVNCATSSCANCASSCCVNYATSCCVNYATSSCLNCATMDCAASCLNCATGSYHCLNCATSRRLDRLICAGPPQLHLELHVGDLAAAERPAPTRLHAHVHLLAAIGAVPAARMLLLHVLHHVLVGRVRVAALRVRAVRAVHAHLARLPGHAHCGQRAVVLQRQRLADVVAQLLLALERAVAAQARERVVLAAAVRRQLGGRHRLPERRALLHPAVVGADDRAAASRRPWRATRRLFGRATSAVDGW